MIARLKLKKNWIDFEPGNTEKRLGSDWEEIEKKETLERSWTTPAQIFMPT